MVLSSALLVAACSGAPASDPLPAAGLEGDAGTESADRGDATTEPGGGGSSCDPPAGCYGPPRRVGAFPVERVAGASGLAASRRNPGLLYLLDDREGTAEVWVIEEDGAMLGSLAVSGLAGLDTEDLAVGPCSVGSETTCVYVGDIGNNLRLREHVSVHRFVEPDLADGVPEAAVSAEVADLRYPDDPPDAEALLVDDRGDLFVVTKAAFDSTERRTGETRLYRARGFGDQTLESLGPVPVPAPETPLHSLVVGDVVTAGDYHDRRVLLRTYDQVIEYRPPAQGLALTALADWETRALPSPLEPQSEALAWSADGCGFFTAGEGTGDLWKVPCLP